MHMISSYFIFLKPLNFAINAPKFFWKAPSDTIRILADLQNPFCVAMIVDFTFKAIQDIDEISRVMTLEPGDILFTGTSSGVSPVKALAVLLHNLEKNGNHDR